MFLLHYFLGPFEYLCRSCSGWSISTTTATSASRRWSTSWRASPTTSPNLRYSSGSRDSRGPGQHWPNPLSYLTTSLRFQILRRIGISCRFKKSFGSDLILWTKTGSDTLEQKRPELDPSVDVEVSCKKVCFIRFFFALWNGYFICAFMSCAI